SQSFTYDAADNMLTNSLVGTYTYPAQGATSVRPHAVTQAASTSFTYDANGSLTARGSTALTWDGENRLVGMGTTTFAYDANSKRVRKIGNQTNIYVTPGYKVVGGVATKNISMGGRLVATRVGTTTSWVHTDQVGSVQVITNSSGTLTNRFYHRPFGDR